MLAFWATPPQFPKNLPVKDLAYTVGFEHTAVSWDGVPLEPYTLRVTHVYRRENGEWKIVHRHGDRVSIDQSPPAEASTT
jgi:ketosteroid isomerase-like protein